MRDSPRLKKSFGFKMVLIGGGGIESLNPLNDGPSISSQQKEHGRSIHLFTVKQRYCRKPRNVICRKFTEDQLRNLSTRSPDEITNFLRLNEPRHIEAGKFVAHVKIFYTTKKIRCFFTYLM
jgi:hypothetical protein